MGLIAMVVSLMVGVATFSASLPILEDATSVVSGGGSSNPELQEAKNKVEKVCKGKGDDRLYDPPSGANLSFNSERIKLEGSVNRRGETSVSLDDVGCDVQEKEIGEGGWELYLQGEAEEGKVKFR